MSHNTIKQFFYTAALLTVLSGFLLATQAEKEPRATKSDPKHETAIAQQTHSTTTQQQTTTQTEKKAHTRDAQADTAANTDPTPTQAPPIDTSSAPSAQKTTTTQEIVHEEAIATLSVLGQSYSHPLHGARTTVYDFMRTLAKETPLTFTGMDYGGGMGFFIASINGKENDYKNGKYWIFYINGNKATRGISHTPIHIGDNITWNYEEENK